MQNYQGLQRNYFERVGYSAERFSFDKSIAPSKRTISQKFEVQYKKAINILIDMNIFIDDIKDGHKYSDILINDYLRNIEPQSKNGAAFALVFCCFDFHSKKFIITKQEGTRSWKYLIELIEHPSAEFKRFIEEYGIKIKDLIRYLIFSQKYVANINKYQ
jgi:hypothetical protein